MIDTCLYRFRIGAFNARVRGSGLKTNTVSNTGNYLTDNGFFNIIIFIFYMMIYLYFAICVWGVIVCMLRECKFRSFPVNRFHRLSETEHIYSYVTHSKLLSVVLLYFVFKRDLLSYRFFGIYFGVISKLLFQEFRVRRPAKGGTFRFIANNTAVICTGCLMWIVSVNSALIVIINPSLLNPGPEPLSSIRVTSFNVHGLIPFSQLNEVHPSLVLILLKCMN